LSKKQKNTHKIREKLRNKKHTPRNEDKTFATGHKKAAAYLKNTLKMQTNFCR